MSRLLEFASVAGEGAFVVQSFSGSEELSRLFEYRVELLSEFDHLKPEDLLGSNATVSLEMPGGQSRRYFNGYISRFAVLGQTRTPAFRSGTGFLYQATLSPWLWFLTRTSTSQIFQHKTLAQVIEEVFSRWSALKSVDLRLTAETELRDYCVQYRETDFNFFSRLAEQAGICYFFTHENGRHTLVLVNESGSHRPLPGAGELRFASAGDSAGTLTQWDTSAEIQPGAYAIDDFHYEKPRTALGKVASLERDHRNAGFELYEYPGEYVEPAWGEKYALIRLEELHCQYESGHAGGIERAVQVGFRFRLADHPVAAQNREYLVIRHGFQALNNLADASGSGGASFHCDFGVIPAATQFRPARLTPRPSIAGPQTAIVVGPAGEEIYTDDLGRVKVQFHWDRYSKGNEQDSCWVRVSQPWAGKGWGAVSIPRIGQEVVVQFLEGDPDRPLITGRVYNADNTPPYPKLTENKARTGFVTRTYKGGNDDFNELRFDDKKQAEQVYLQAQRNLDVRVKKDRHDFVGGEQHRTVEKDVFEKLGATLHTTITGDHSEKLDGSLSFKVGQDTHLKSGMKILQDAGMEIHLKAGMKVVIEAGAQLTLKVGGNFIDINPAGVFIKGTMVMVNSGGSAGSGSGAAPLAPQAPKAAMTSTGGQKEEPMPPRERPKAYGPQASSFKVAARLGSPFCKVCAAAS